MISNEHRVAVVTGSAGVVARFQHDVVVIGGRSAAVSTAMATLDTSDITSPSTNLAERLRGITDVDIAAVVTTPEGFEVITVGNGLVASPDGQPVESTTPVVWVGIGPVPSDATARLDGAKHLDLRVGTVPGQGALIAAAVPATDPPPSTPAADPRPSTPLLESELDPPMAPPLQGAGIGAEVMGIQCSRGHFNNPRAAYCQVCGISMVHATHYLVPGPRPTLGFIVFEDGATFALDRSYCVGREPVVSADRDLAPLVLHDDRHSVSRSHAELVLDGWDLVVRDLGSTNGTFVWSAERQMWTRVMPDHAITIDPGTSVAIGRKVFVYESVARSVESPLQ